jgi:hypothetical protein
MTSGSTASLMRCEVKDQCELLVVSLDTGAIWKIDVPPQAWLLGMTDTEIVIGRRTDANDDAAFQELIRYEIARIPELGAKL